MSFKNMKKNRGSIEDLNKKLEASSAKGGGYEKDPRMWYPELDKDKNGYAIIRFLPPAEGTDSAWVKLYSHGFKSKGGWFIENCPTTLQGGDCPVCTHNSELWDAGDKATVRQRKRKLSYYANVYVVSDPKTPENEGQVKIYRFGAKIFEKLTGAASPEFDDETAIDPFDLWEGADFKLKIRKVEGQINYDKSEFAESAPMLKTDAAMEKVWNSQHDLDGIVAKDQFLSYEKLAKSHARVIGGRVMPDVTAESADVPSVDADDAPTAPEANVASEEDSNYSYFQSLAEGD